MKLLIGATILALPAASLAQHETNDHSHDTKVAGKTIKNEKRTRELTETGQAIFAAVQEAVSVFEADPNTDWSKVNIERLRRHLIDMDHVMRLTSVETMPIENGAVFKVSGPAEAMSAIRRMSAGHARAMSKEGTWSYKVRETPAGVEMTVTGSKADEAKIRALGFAGIMARGGHHKSHHYLMASGGSH